MVAPHPESEAKDWNPEQPEICIEDRLEELARRIWQMLFGSMVRETVSTVS